jgi:murein DD-endopeptidase MepM/ murein hydrolase activator NlpD
MASRTLRIASGFAMLVAAFAQNAVARPFAIQKAGTTPHGQAGLFAPPCDVAVAPEGVARPALEPVKCTYTGLKPLTPIGDGTSTPSTPTTTPSTPQTPAPKPATDTTGGTVPTMPSGTDGAPSKPAPSPAPGLGFAYHAPGDLVPQDADRARKGDRFIYLKDIVYPLRLGPNLHPHMNSQIWGHGGGGWGKTKGPGGTECDPANYDPMLQRDNYCEVRDHDSTHKMPLCPKGYGHQGQDIRPPDCPHHNWEAVAVVDGTILTVTGFSYLTLQGKDGTVYAYLHMSSTKVKKGQKVKQGDVLGHVSNIMDYEAGGTTYHLHFQVQQQIKVAGKTIKAYVPVYSSLIAAYRKSKGLDPGIDAAGNLIVDPALEIGAAPAPQPEPPKPTPAPAPEPAPTKPAEQPPAPEKKPDVTPAPAPVPEPAPSKPPEQPPAPEKKPDVTPAPAPAPEPAPSKPAEQPPAPEKKPDATPAPAPAPEPAPSKPAEQPPAPEKKPDVTPAPAPDQPEAGGKNQGSWWQSVKDTVGGWWNYWSGKK